MILKDKLIYQEYTEIRIRNFITSENNPTLEKMSENLVSVEFVIKINNVKNQIYRKYYDFFIH